MNAESCFFKTAYTTSGFPDSRSHLQQSNHDHPVAAIDGEFYPHPTTTLVHLFVGPLQELINRLGNALLAFLPLADPQTT